ncbi:MAG: sulfite exporter TauE/SafE family protein [Gammaproteobacteria bacterium]|nr:sulfite exporter TauE/SafE family protein [Gammaproteobacteria bacterium]
MTLSLGVAFLLGLASTLHCWGMCGGIIGALTLGVPPAHGRAGKGHWVYPLAYNVGRIGSYALMGALAGLTGLALVGGARGGIAYWALQILAGAVLVCIGLRVAGWAPALHFLESVGLPLWRRLQPLGRRLLPIDHPGKAVLMGMLWGWIPCGLVYSVVLWTLPSADPLVGAGILLSFGAGTLPGMVGAGLAGGYARTHRLAPNWRRLAGMALVLMGLLSPAIHLMQAPAGGHAHAAHDYR